MSIALFIYSLLSNGHTGPSRTHCPLFNPQGVGTGPASYLRAGVQWARQRTFCTETASVRRSVVCLSCAPNPRARSWGFSSRLWSLSAMLDLLDVNCRRNVQADSLCRRTSASCVIPLVQSATGMSCLNALPVESVSLSYLFSQHSRYYIWDGGRFL